VLSVLPHPAFRVSLDALASAQRLPTGAVLLALCALPALAQAPLRMPSPNGPVYAFATIGNTAYVGGAFDRIGLYSGGGVAIDGGTAKARSGNPGFRASVVSPSYPGGLVTAAVADGAGGWFVGGDFLSLGGTSRRYLAHVDANGDLLAWTPPTPDASVWSLLLSGDTLFVGGDFTTLGGSARSHLAAVDATTGALFGWDPGANDRVTALALSGTTLYVGGSFNSLGGAVRPLVGAVDTGTGVATSWAPDVAGAWVECIALGAGVAYVGGVFSSIQGVGRANAAAVNLVTGAASSWNPNPNGSIRRMIITGTTVLACGEFTTIGGRSRTGLAQLNTTNGNATASWNANSDDYVYDFALSGTTLHVGGAFTTIGGQPRSNVGAIHAATALATSWAPAVDGQVWTIAPSGGHVWLGGRFQRVDVVTRRSLAAIDLVARTVTTWNPDVVGTVRALVTDGSTLWVGGSFSQAGGLARKALAAYALPSSTPTAFDAQVNQGSAIVPEVMALALGSGVLYVGGIMDQLGGQVRNGAGAVDPVTGAVNAWAPEASSVVRAIRPSVGGVYLAGSFMTVGDSARRLLAQVDPATGAVTSWVPPTFSGGFSSEGVLVPANLFSLAERSGVLYVGGSFQSVAGLARANHVALDPVGAVLPWSVVDLYVTDSGMGTMALDADGDDVLSASNTPVTFRFRVLDPTSGADELWPPSLLEAYAVDRAGGHVLVGGAFLDAGAVPSPNLAVFLDPGALSVADAETPSVLALSPPFPNPARVTSSIAWRLARPTVVSVSLVDLAGRKVRSIVERTELAAGPHARTLDVAGLAPGLYLLAAEAGGVRTSHKLLVVR
jgi:hypothetical protein